MWPCAGYGKMRRWALTVPEIVMAPWLILVDYRNYLRRRNVFKIKISMDLEQSTRQKV